LNLFAGICKNPQIDELNLKHDLAPDHNRSQVQNQPDPFSEMVKTFKESVLKTGNH
jgi:hypothetical protein